MIRRPPRSTQSRSSAASDVYKRQVGRRQGLLREADHQSLSGGGLRSGCCGVGRFRRASTTGGQRERQCCRRDESTSTYTNHVLENHLRIPFHLSGVTRALKRNTPVY